jgi:hypothetical protein
MSKIGRHMLANSRMGRSPDVQTFDSPYVQFVVTMCSFE